MTTRSNQDVQRIGQTGCHSSNEKTNSSARFWNWMAERYAAKPVVNEDAYRQKLATTRKYLNADSEVLELGCGTGSTALAHAPYVKHIRAFDFSSKMIEIADNKALSLGVDNIDFVCGAANNAEAPNAKYDAILALSLLHLLFDWSGTIEAAYRMLKPGGVFVTSTMCMNDSYTPMRLIAPIGFSVGLLPQLSFFTRAELEYAMFKAGFETEHVWQPTPKSSVFVVARKGP